VVVLHLATPYGVTSDLNIPVAAGGPALPVLDWNPDSTPVVYRYTQSGSTPFTVAPTDIYVQDPKHLEIRVLGGIIPPPTVSIALSFKGLNTGIGATTTLTNIALDSQKNIYVIDTNNFTTLHTALNAAIVSNLILTNPTTPPPSFMGEVEATVQAPGYPSLPLKNKLSVPIQFIKK